MGLLDGLAPKYYKVLRMGLQRSGAEVVALYDIGIYNESGRLLDTISPAASLTAQEKTAVAGIFSRDKTTFEAATGLVVLPEETG